MPITLEQEPHGGEYSLLQMSIDYLARLIMPAFFETALNIRQLESVISPSAGWFRRQTLAAEGGPRVPLLNLTISSYDRAEGWNYRAHQLTPRIGNPSERRDYYHAARLTPIQVTLAATFVTDDVDQQLAVVERLFGDTSELHFTTVLKDDAGVDAMRLDHSAYLDFGFTPDNQDDTESGDYHNLQFGIILRTWVGKLYHLPAVLEVRREDSTITRFTDDDLIIQPLGTYRIKPREPRP